MYAEGGGPPGGQGASEASWWVLRWMPPTCQRWAPMLAPTCAYLDHRTRPTLPQVYELLADESHAVRHAVAELVAAMLEEQGRAVLEVRWGGAWRAFSWC